MVYTLVNYIQHTRIYINTWASTVTILKNNSDRKIPRMYLPSKPSLPTIDIGRENKDSRCSYPKGLRSKTLLYEDYLNWQAGTQHKKKKEKKEMMTRLGFEPRSPCGDQETC